MPARSENNGPVRPHSQDERSPVGQRSPGIDPLTSSLVLSGPGKKAFYNSYSSEMIDRHWDGIAAYCRPENKVPLGFVEGLNNKIRVLQRRAYGLRDEEYLRLKILTCMLPEI